MKKESQERLKKWRNIKMELNEFMQETDKLEKFYNKELEKYEKDIWFQEIKTIPLKRYQQIIKKAFTECKFMPKLADIITINKDLPYNTNNNVINKKIECKICEGLGVVEYFKKTDGIAYQYFARCKCENGNNFNYDGTKISENKSKFYIPTLAQINL